MKMCVGVQRALMVFNIDALAQEVTITLALCNSAIVGLLYTENGEVARMSSSISKQ